MKKNLITLALVLMAMIPARAQQLQNTYWTIYTPTNVLAGYFYFCCDTLSESPDNITYTQVTTYVENGNLFTIIDLPGSPGGCPITDSGRYTFSILSDTLYFILISDPCAGRSYVLLNYHFVRLLTGIENVSFNSDQLYPNPSPDGIFNLSFTNNSDGFDKIIVSTAQGKKVSEENIPRGERNHSINLQNLSSGVYFLMLENNKERKVFKIVK